MLATVSEAWADSEPQAANLARQSHPPQKTSPLSPSQTIQLAVRWDVVLAAALPWGSLPWLTPHALGRLGILAVVSSESFAWNPLQVATLLASCSLS